MASPQYTGPQQPQYGGQPGIQPTQEKTYPHDGMPQQQYSQQQMPQQQYPQQQMPQQQYAQQPMPQSTYASATPLVSLQQGPAPVDCPMCRVRQMTRVEFVSGGTTHVVALLCCLGLCCGCIPYLTTWFKDVEHKCGNCGALLAVWHRSGRTEVIAHATQ